ncbi:complex I NDUFA9 subunit family protein [Aestuariispira insulae]|uniref:NADH dehydrogenase n=1 Tax=Aestuariispira insulae TaxID=1461337 RepID=A0A3D9H9N8_9PROT|nr:complex I NDUFA9 subunit family protein [Aestuariispira insulae]RED46195.1 NADH dehydrogenase [Aestuariispira insulae]
MRPNKVTVFGGSGFIGRSVVRRLAQMGCQVIVAVRDPEGALFLKPYGEIGQVTPVMCNIRDEKAVRMVMQGSDAVVNLVGILHESGKQTFDAIQHKGAETIARVAKELGIANFVQMSALGADKASDSEYARAKAAGEEAVLSHIPTASILRPSIVFGPNDDFFNKFASMPVPGFPLIGGGKTKFQPVYVEDVAEAVTKCLCSNDANGKVFELGGPTVYSFEELLRLVMHEMGVHKGLVPLPFFLANIIGLVGEIVGKLPIVPVFLTRDQVRQLRHDNILSGEKPGLEDLGVKAHAAEVILPTYMDRYRPGGQFNPMKMA